MRSMCSTVLFSLTESRTSFHAPPCSLKTSFCGSVNRIAVSCLLMFIILSFSIVVCCGWACHGNELLSSSPLLLPECATRSRYGFRRFLFHHHQGLAGPLVRILSTSCE